METSRARRLAIATLVVLTAINFLNYIDRNIVGAVLEPMRQDLGLEDTESGLLQSAFMVVYMVVAPFTGYVGDRWIRKRVVAVGVMLWSFATVGSGLARDYETLLVMRALVGIGEAGYATVAPSMIADLFRSSTRGRMLAYFYLAIPMGSALGYVLGGWVGEHYGWRAAFFVAGAPGLAFAVLAAAMYEPPRGALDDIGPGSPLGVRASLLRLAGSPAWRIGTTGMTLMTFAMGGLAFWMPTYLVRTQGLGLAQANTLFGGVTVAAGLLGTLVGGFLGDRAQGRGQGGYFWVSGWGLLLGAPLVAMVPFLGSSSQIFVAVFFAELLLFLNTGPLNAALVGCVPARLRAGAVAVNVFVIHAFGDALSPTVMGAISQNSSLHIAIASTGIPLLIGGVVLIWGGRLVSRMPAGLLTTNGWVVGESRDA